MCLWLVDLDHWVLEEELYDGKLPIKASPVEGCSVGSWISPIEIDSWVIGKDLHKIKVARGAGFPQLLLFGCRHSERNEL